MDIERLIGVYDADGTVVGELSYVLGRALGRRHCSLCDITHGRVRRKPEMDACARELGVPLDLLHRDEQPTALAAVTSGRLPCVVAEVGGDLVVLLEPAALDACAGEPTALVAALREAATGAGLRLPGIS